MNFLIKNFALTILGLSLFLVPVFAGAVVTNDNNYSIFNSNNPPVTNNNLSPVSNSNSIFKLQNPLNYETICGLIQGLLKVFITIGIPIAVLFLVYSGFLFVWARGSVEGLNKARKNLFYTLLGIALFLGAWFLGQVIASTINALSPGTVGQTTCK